MKASGRLFAGLLLSAAVSAHGATLLDLYHETMASDPRLQKSEAEVAVFQAREKGARAGLLPQVSAGAQGTRTVRESADTQGLERRDHYDGERYYLSLSQPLYDKARWEAFRSAGKEADQYSVRHEDFQSLVAVDVVDRYTKVLAAEDNYAFVVAEREAAQEQYRQVDARYRRQMAKVTDLLAVEARANILVSQELEALNQVSIARESMSELLGREVSEPFAPLREDIHIAWDFSNLEDWVARGLQSSKHLQSARLAVETAKGRVKEAQGRRHPTLSVNLNAQKTDIGYENAPTPLAETYVAALNLSMPLYTGGQISAQVDEAQARLRMAEQEYQQADRLLRKEIREAFLRSRSAMDRVAATRKAVVAADKSYQAQKKGFGFGTVTVVDVMTASETLFEAQRDYRQAYYDLMVQGMTLFQVSGEFSPQNVADINAWLEAAGQPGS
ncbi:MAG: TolC family outer membrane protein [Porticoccaceae bacterium]